ncbi:universal stress protein [Pedobacter alluvionis]|uniref:Nucleotide-binding universal stress UspA family protein n=1 Tax=Pedobacter alluvionis TaxID=475253 RepID=A0A497XT94_9SPHI|nr:universal stress protein [Pedobacter alluvionis]RLJ72549.1 nucleotide-binding universal stress UspA family protein [Pedobacter alluvionis]TFB28132.1 universal stress protein [Pedobacter alluvionis]
MKKILIATDFSVAADNAARYALELAHTIKADTVLVNAAAVTTDSPTEILWPAESYQALIKRTNVRLEDLAKELQDSIPHAVKEADVCPTISIKSDLGSVTDLLKEIVQQQRIGLVVMGLSGAGNIKRLILGSSSRDVIDAADYPVLLVPKETPFKPIHKIAFATDLGLNDMESIQVVAAFAGLLKAELLIVHVIRRNADHDITNRISAFMSELRNKINYDRIYYENVYQSKVENGLGWLKDHGETDLLVMLHRKHGILNDFINGSHAQNMARKTKLPLLVIPEGYRGTLC